MPDSCLDYNHLDGILCSCYNPILETRIDWDLGNLQYVPLPRSSQDEIVDIVKKFHLTTSSREWLGMDLEMTLNWEFDARENPGIPPWCVRVSSRDTTRKEDVSAPLLWETLHVGGRCAALYDIESSFNVESGELTTKYIFKVDHTWKISNSIDFDIAFGGNEIHAIVRRGSQPELLRLRLAVRKLVHSYLMAPRDVAECARWIESLYFSSDDTVKIVTDTDSSSVKEVLNVTRDDLFTFSEVFVRGLSSDCKEAREKSWPIEKHVDVVKQFFLFCKFGERLDLDRNVVKSMTWQQGEVSSFAVPKDAAFNVRDLLGLVHEYQTSPALLNKCEIYLLQDFFNAVARESLDDILDLGKIATTYSLRLLIGSINLAFEEAEFLCKKDDRMVILDFLCENPDFSKERNALIRDYCTSSDTAAGLLDT